jgi:hypothetical protein
MALGCGLTSVRGDREENPENSKNIQRKKNVIQNSCSWKEISSGSYFSKGIN